MSQPLVTLLKDSLKAWFGARGFAMVVVAALVPTLLTGAWVATHQADVAVTHPEWDRERILEGDLVNFTATVENVGSDPVDAFDLELRVMRLSADPNTGEPIRRLVQGGDSVVEVPGLAAGESADVNLTWAAQVGLFDVVVTADPDNKIPEIEELNNEHIRRIFVNPRTPDPATAPREPGGLAGNASANTTANVQILNLTWTPEEPTIDGQGTAPVTFEARIRNVGPDAIRNGTVHLQLGPGAGEVFYAQRQQSFALDLGPNETTTVNAAWRLDPNAYWVRGYVDVGDDAHDPDAGDNHVSAPLSVSVDPSLFGATESPPPEELATVKGFYDGVLRLIHFTVLVPFIALFYASGVLASDKAKGNLPYLLTRPVSRPMIPVVRFAAGYVVAAAALVLGVIATYALLFLTTNEQSLGYLLTPLLTGLVALLVYGAFFTLLGVLVERPYLVGGAIVLGWEIVVSFIAEVGIQMGLFQDWVRNLTLRHHVIEVLSGWPMDAGLLWWPTAPEATTRLIGLLVVAVGFLLVTAGAMRKREFEL